MRIWRTSLGAAMLWVTATGLRGEDAKPVDFEKAIRPILERACVQCHGAEKQKGKLRLDTREGVLKGGENGPSVKIEEAEQSEFLRRVKLENAHEDVMPPKGKAEHLTAAEIDSVKRWIAEGATWPAGVVAVAAKNSSGNSIGPSPTLDEQAARAALAKLGVRVRPLATGVNWSRLTLRPLAPEVPPEVWANLAQLVTLVELDLSTVKLPETVLATVAGLPNVASLNLSESSVRDADLDAFTQMEKLTSLNVFGTAITDAGLLKLQSMPKLRQLYVAQTGVTKEGLAQLQQYLPDLRVRDGADFLDLSVPAPPPKAP